MMESFLPSAACRVGKNTNAGQHYRMPSVRRTELICRAKGPAACWSLARVCQTERPIAGNGPTETLPVCAGLAAEEFTSVFNFMLLQNSGWAERRGRHSVFRGSAEAQCIVHDLVRRNMTCSAFQQEGRNNAESVIPLPLPSMQTPPVTNMVI